MKTCRKCKVEKLLERFPPRKESKDKRGYVCRACMKTYRPGQAARDRERYANDPEYRARRLAYYREYARNHPRSRDHRTINYRRNYKFGMTVELYDALHALQGEVCAICRGLPTRTEHLHVDHDHATHEIRGLLCDNCNLGLGKLKDSLQILEAAVAYLKKPPAVVLALARSDSADEQADEHPLS